MIHPNAYYITARFTDRTYLRGIMAKPTIKDVTALLIELKKHIGDDYRATDDPDDDVPGICVTLATNDKRSDWTYQTGDNSYSGGCYHYPHWAVLTLYRRSNCKDLARDVLSQWNALTEWR